MYVVKSCFYLCQCKDYLCEYHLPVTWVKSDLVERVRGPNILEKTVELFVLLIVLCLGLS